tara:strand:+ start:291 stop:398 length:108 start_codon:yes stop_codon:yes gene_type:complete
MYVVYFINKILRVSYKEEIIFTIEFKEKAKKILYY